MTSKCISELQDLGLQLHLQNRSITASKCISEFNLISASKCISELLDLGLLMHLQTCSITASKYISKPARSQPPCASLSSTRSRPASASPKSLYCGLQVHLPVHTITASKCISKFSQSASPGAPAITLQYRLPPYWPNVYI